MAKRTLQRTFTDLMLYGIGLTLIAVAFLIMLVRQYPAEMVIIMLAVVGGGIGVRQTRLKNREENWNCAKVFTDRQLDRHKSALISYFRQSIRRDLFGNEDSRPWHDRIQTFIGTQVLPGLRTRSVKVDDSTPARLAAYVDSRVRQIADSNRNGELPELDLTSLNPLQYEHHCASILFGRGWTVHPTPVTGDRGADLVAEKNGARLVIQCKLYSRPVGNKAVQEVHSARHLYNCTYACVVAPNGFTRQAEQDAHAHGIHLLHHSGLGQFADDLRS